MIPRILGPSQAKSRPEAFRLRALLLLSLIGWVLGTWSCVPAPPPADLPEPSGPPVPRISAGSSSRSDEREANRVLLAAQDSLSAGSPQAALSLAEDVISRFSAVPGSARALWIKARALGELGRPAGAAEAAESLLSLLDPAHPLYPPVTLFQARELGSSGDTLPGLHVLLRLPPGTPDSVLTTALELAREWIPALSFEQLNESTQALQADHPFRGFMATELAVALYLRGEEEEAIRWARTALLSELEPREEELAEGVVQARLEEVLGRPVILGVVIPRTGVSPGLTQYGDWFYEGVQVAVGEYQDQLPRPVQLEVLDDRGSPLGARTAIRTLEGVNAMAALGFLSQDILQEAAQDRQSVGQALISPFAYLPPDEAPNVYSLSGPDLGEAVQLARVARDLELNTVVIVRPRTMEAELDGEAFRQEFQDLGGVVPRDIVFDSGGTFFQPQFQEVEAILPDGMFLPLQPGDIQLFAPQITFYGMDTLGVQILGTSGWTDPAVVQEVDSRHTDGVVAATARLTQDETEAFRHFREAYEAQFHKTLRNDVPAYGYDAAALVLEALKNHPRNPEELVAALEEIRDLPGATGVLSIQGGGVRREPRLVRIQDHELIYIDRRDK